MPVLDRIDPKLLKNIKSLPVEEQAEILNLIEELEEAEKKDLLYFHRVAVINY